MDPNMSIAEQVKQMVQGLKNEIAGMEKALAEKKAELRGVLENLRGERKPRANKKSATKKPPAPKA